MKRLAELILVLGAAMWPTFAFAGQIDADEYLKSGVGTAGVAAVYAIWRRKKDHE